jgi:hypothetical protein
VAQDLGLGIELRWPKSREHNGKVERSHRIDRRSFGAATSSLRLRKQYPPLRPGRAPTTIAASRWPWAERRLPRDSPQDSPPKRLRPRCERARPHRPGWGERRSVAREIEGSGLDYTEQAAIFRQQLTSRGERKEGSST